MAPGGRGGMTVDDGRRRKLYGSDEAYGGDGLWRRWPRRMREIVWDCFLCQLFISVTSRVLDKMYIKREREAHSCYNR